MKKSLIILGLVGTLVLGRTSMTSAELPLGLGASIEWTTEDETDDKDSSIFKTEVSLERPFEVGKIEIIPYTWATDESFHNFISQRDERAWGVGIDVVVFGNKYVKIIPGLAYEDKDKHSGDNDHLFITKLKVENKLPGKFKLISQIVTEDETDDKDSSIFKTKVTLKRPFGVAKIEIIPYTWAEDESYHSFISQRKEREVGGGIDVVVFKNDYIKITPGLA